MRLFYAVAIDADIAARIVAATPDHRSLRRVHAEEMHVTLRFLGDRDSTVLPALSRAGAEVAGRRPGAVGASIADWCWLPSPRRPRVLALRLTAPALGDIAHSLDEALAAGGIGAADERFLSHLTAARVRRNAAAVALPPQVHGEFVIDAFGLYESTLSPDGARYRCIERFALG